MRNGKRILSVSIRQILDESPDTSWIGEYSSSPDRLFAIDRNHSEDCPRFWPNEDIPEDTPECDCAPVPSRELDYFNPGSVESFKLDASWIPAEITDAAERKTYWDKAMRQNARQDYERMEELNNGYFHFVGVRAEAQIAIDTATRGVATLQTVSSPGLWGIESDSENSYLNEVEQDELSNLRHDLVALGFSKRAISAAFKNVEHKEE